MTTLVCCVDRSNDIGRNTGVRMPVSGWEAVRSLVTEIGLVDPEDSTVNCLLEGLRIARDLRDEQEDAVVAVVSGGGDSMVTADRSIAAQLEELIERYDPDAAIVVVDSAQDERIIPIVESRIPVDGVSRVVVRQSRDIESTYYLLKQFLGDEELRSTVLVPLGIALLLLPVLLLQFSPAVALAGLAGLLGAALLYKGMAIDEYVSNVPERAREALYAGQVSIVTYVVAVGLALVGVFFGVLSASELSGEARTVVPVMQFVYSSVPWLATAALTASTGRLLDEAIREEGIRTPYLNLPFVVVALGLVVRGFAGYVLEQEAILGSFELFGVTIPALQRLAAFIVAGLIVSLVGVKVAADVGSDAFDEVLEPESEEGESR
ncbi:putative membrane protein [Halalkaliarchaeum desulfuricum]|uniref:Putative membrane protein n=1 Tax=Halalkaliarchaeum desulfuricum TaxID=2055893 RepID=A0A343TIT6_9EURY|nr:DUF373 family protein [Halalkaliarchaeum desulfuricum]AUX09008.1 putative membrane protein [Halalkaliarchaeum desulfuricum]